MSKGKEIALWIVTGLLAALFLFAATPKLLTPEKIRPMFTQFGYAAWFLTFIGCSEALGAIGLLIPRVAAFAAAGLSIIMVGALYTTASHHMYKESITPVIVFALLIWVANTRIKERATESART